MPIYEYQCEQCRRRVELIQKRDDPPLGTCPTCQGAMRKLLAAPALQFKGSGWYITDYSDKGKAKTDAGSAETKTGEAKTGETKPGEAKTAKEPAAETKPAADKKADSGGSPPPPPPASKSGGDGKPS